MLNTFDLTPPQARQILYSEGTPDIVPVNEEGSEVTLPISQNPYGQWVIVNAANASIRNFGGNAKKNVLVNNASGRVDVEYDPVRSAGAQIKIFDNSGTLHLREPNDFKELPIVQPYGANS
ncbi:hypothetical protein cyc_03793 [Cyclospora cayetanensis]|uniref:Uncharacterized protein n=1 Tax=Cyclospora cayetanensis TaxID=88456 RepID=A0A1D3D2G0_9EIME|nr:hypothetical protein cyc_03793 [Cyclospora cayetanensis]